MRVVIWVSGGNGERGETAKTQVLLLGEGEGFLRK